MSAALQDNNKCNELEDDRESSHVLTWAVLRFIKHTISSGGSSRLLRALMRSTKTKTVSRDLKKAFLLGCDIPRAVKFVRRPHLDELIAELTETYAVLYEMPPAKDLQALEDARVANIPESVMTNLPAFSYQKHLDDLAAPS